MSTLNSDLITRLFTIRQGPCPLTLRTHFGCKSVPKKRLRLLFLPRSCLWSPDFHLVTSQCLLLASILAVASGSVCFAAALSVARQSTVPTADHEMRRHDVSDLAPAGLCCQHFCNQPPGSRHSTARHATTHDVVYSH